MSFTGKATYSGGAAMPEIMEDVSDLVGIVSPAETPLLDALGDSVREARSTVHEWLEDELLPNTDTLAAPLADALNQVTLTVDHLSRFRVGDQVRATGHDEVMLVTAINTGGNTLTVTRAYGGSPRCQLTVGGTLRILGNAALEGDAADAARFTLRSRKQNYTQIFSSTVEVSGSELAVRQAAVGDELNYQKQMRLREMVRDLENCVINGRASAANPAGTSIVRRTMNGILAMITSNVFAPGNAQFPGDTDLTEEQLNTALREIWLASGSPVDLILVGAHEKRQINSFATAHRSFAAADERYRDLVSVYESDFGVCRVILSRYVPKGTVLLLDSSRIEVLPLGGRSFGYKPLASTGDRESGQVLGEYTLEFRNENAHGVITGLDA
jgi:Family of unknown function (DUF5309)